MNLDSVLTNCTIDTILQGRLSLAQPKLGYRFSMDSLLLIDFVSKGIPMGNVLDVGAGVGLIGLALAQQDERNRVTLVEIQSLLAALCRWNASRNHLDERVRVVEADVLDKKTQRVIGLGVQDWVVTCPPYFKVGTGDVSPQEELATARYETKLPLSGWVEATARLLKPQGKLGVVFPADRSLELLSTLLSKKLHPARIRWVHSKASQPAQRILVEAIKQESPTLQVEPPLFVRDEFGRSLL